MNFQFNPETGTMEPQDKIVFDMEKKVENDKIVKDKPAPSIPKSNGRDIVRERQKHNLNLNEQVLSFKELSDRDIINILDDQTNTSLCCISGYDLHFSFNLHELRSVQRIEQCLDGLTKLFRNKITEELATAIADKK